MPSKSTSWDNPNVTPLPDIQAMAKAWNLHSHWSLSENPVWPEGKFSVAPWVPYACAKYWQNKWLEDVLLLPSAEETVS